MTELAYEVKLSVPQDQAIERVVEALKQEGFGVLTRIDVDKTLKEKIGADFRPYTILGACNPVLAQKALSNRPEAGLLLPCNVVVESAPQGSLIRIVDPAAMMRAGGLDDDPVLHEVGTEAEEKLKRVAANLAG